MQTVTITRNLDAITVKLLAEIAEREAGTEFRSPNESATLRRMIHAEAQRIGIVVPAPQTPEKNPRRTKQPVTA